MTTVTTPNNEQEPLLHPLRFPFTDCKHRPRFNGDVLGSSEKRRNNAVMWLALCLGRLFLLRLSEYAAVPPSDRVGSGLRPFVV